MPEEEGRWLPVEASDIAVGDLVRGTSNGTTSWTPEDVEGRVVRVIRPGGRNAEVELEVEDPSARRRDLNPRRWERWTPLVREHRWERVEHPTTLRPGDHVRVMEYDQESENGRVCHEGEVEEISAPDRFGDRYVRIDGAGWNTTRPYFRRVEVTPEPEYTWVPIERDALREGMYVRGTSLPEYSVVPIEGHITTFRGDNEVRVDQPGRGYVYLDRRQWERRVPANVAALDETVAQAVASEPEPLPFAPPQQGEVFNRTYDDGRDTRPGCTVHRVVETDDGWRVSYANQGSRVGAATIRVHRDGTCRSEWGRGNPGRFERVAPTVEVGIVLAAPRVGDRFTRTFDNPPPPHITERTGCEVTSVLPRDEGWFITYRRGGENYTRRLIISPDGTAVPLLPVPYQGTTYPADRFRGRYVPEVAPPVRNVTVTEAAIPVWATSLDAARRYVHAEAWKLYHDSSNCRSGTTDFLVAADLPEEREFPAPPDESAQIRAFLLKVRLAALETADAHGKSMSQVRAWLERHGIMDPPPPPPVEHTFTVTAPAGTTREDVISSARQLGRQGWEIR